MLTNARVTTGSAIIKDAFFRARFQHMKAFAVWLVADQMMKDLIYVSHQFRSRFNNESA